MLITVISNLIFLADKIKNNYILLKIFLYNNSPLEDSLCVFHFEYDVCSIP